MSNKTGQTLGERIKSVFKERGLNQSLIAKKMGVSKQVINQIDRRKHFDLEFLQKIKDASGLDFTNYNFKDEGPFLQVNENTPGYNSQRNESQQVEMALSVKIKSEPNEIGKIADLILTIRREAKKMGFTVM